MIAGELPLAGADRRFENATDRQRQEHHDTGDREPAAALLIGVLGIGPLVADVLGMLTVIPATMTTRRPWSSQSFIACSWRRSADSLTIRRRTVSGSRLRALQ
jgi:hypothetical protein